MTYSSAWFDDTSPVGDATGSTPPSSARSTASSTSPASGRVAGAGDRHRLGRAGHPGRRARRHRHHGDPVAEQRALAQQRVDAAGLARPGRASRCATTATSTGGSTRSVSVEMIEAVGEEYWPTYFATIDGCSRRAAGSASRRSPCRTTGCWPPGTPTPGSTSTSSPAGCSPRLTRSRTTWPRTPRCRHRTPRHGRRTTPRRCGCGGSGSLGNWQQRRRARLRRQVPPDVGVLPRLLRGRLPHRLPRHLAAATGEDDLMDLRNARVWVVGASVRHRRRGRSRAGTPRRPGGGVGPLRRRPGEGVRWRHVRRASRRHRHAAVAAAAQQVTSELGGIDVLVAAAGYWQQTTPGEATWTRSPRMSR